VGSNHHFPGTFQRRRRVRDVFLWNVCLRRLEDGKGKI